MNLNFFLYQPKTKILIILLGLGIGFLFLITIILSLFQGETPNQSTDPLKERSIERGIPVIVDNKVSQEERTFSSYQETLIGKTTDTEISRLPNLISKEATDSGRTIYYFESTDSLRKNVVETQNGTATFKRVTSITAKSNKTPLVEGYTSQYGEPEYQFTGSNRYGPDMKTNLYPSQGFALIFNPYTDEVFEIQSFTPVSIEEYKLKWGQDINENLQNERSDKL